MSGTASKPGLGLATRQPSQPASKPSPRSKVFWSDIEKAMIVKRAVDLREERPGLAGLPLLRASLDVLPAHRRRDLIALSQALWFTRMVGDETKRREMEAKLQDNTVSVLRENRGQHTEWMSEHIARFDRLLAHVEGVSHDLEAHRLKAAESADRRARWEGQVVSLLGQVCGELRDLNTRLSSVEGGMARPGTGTEAAGRARGPR